MRSSNQDERTQHANQSMFAFSRGCHDMSLYIHPCLCHTQDGPQLLCSHEFESQKRVILDPTLVSKHPLGRRTACFLVPVPQCISVPQMQIRCSLTGSKPLSSLDLSDTRWLLGTLMGSSQVMDCSRFFENMRAEAKTSLIASLRAEV